MTFFTHKTKEQKEITEKGVAILKCTPMNRSNGLYVDLASTAYSYDKQNLDRNLNFLLEKARTEYENCTNPDEIGQILTNKKTASYYLRIYYMVINDSGEELIKEFNNSKTNDEPSGHHMLRIILYQRMHLERKRKRTNVSTKIKHLLRSFYQDLDYIELGAIYDKEKTELQQFEMDWRNKGQRFTMKNIMDLAESAIKRNNAFAVRAINLRSDIEAKFWSLLIDYLSQKHGDYITHSFGLISLFDEIVNTPSAATEKYCAPFYIFQFLLALKYTTITVSSGEKLVETAVRYEDIDAHLSQGWGHHLLALMKLNRAVNAFDETNDQQNHDVLKYLSQTAGNMTAAIEKGFNYQKYFLTYYNEISEQIKTTPLPITPKRLMTSFLLEEAFDKKTSKQYTYLLLGLICFSYKMYDHAADQFKQLDNIESYNFENLHLQNLQNIYMPLLSRTEFIEKIIDTAKADEIFKDFKLILKPEKEMAAIVRTQNNRELLQHILLALSALLPKITTNNLGTISKIANILKIINCQFFIFSINKMTLPKHLKDMLEPIYQELARIEQISPYDLLSQAYITILPHDKNIFYPLLVREFNARDCCDRIILQYTQPSEESPMQGEQDRPPEGEEHKVEQIKR